MAFPPASVSRLEDLDDVDLTGQTDGELLKRSGNLWVAGPLSGDVHVDITSELFADIFDRYEVGHFVGPLTKVGGAWDAVGGVPGENVAGSFNCLALIIPKRTRFDQLAYMHNATATLGAFRFGVYADGGLMGTGPPLLEVPIVADGVNAVHFVAINLTLQPGLYWVACLVDVVANGGWGCHNSLNKGQIRNAWRSDEIGLTSGQFGLHRKTGAGAIPTGALPNPYPPAAVVSSSNQNIVGAFFRIAAIGPDA